jgi:hypothetical protein
MKNKQKKDTAGKNNNNKKEEEEDGIIRGPDGSISCCIPWMKCTRIGQPLPQTLADGIKLSCTNSECLYVKHLVHPECFRSLEANLMTILTFQGCAKGWTEGHSNANLWGRKGLSLCQKKLRCPCGKGQSKRDDEAWIKREELIGPPQPEKKEKKKHKPKAALPILVHTGAPHALDKHYLSSHSPPPSEAALEERYGPTSSAVRTRRETDTSITSNNTKPIKKHVPIGFAPIESPAKPLIPEPEPHTQIPSPEVNSNVETNSVDEDTEEWKTVERHRVKSETMESKSEDLVNHHNMKPIPLMELKIEPPVEVSSSNVESKPVELLRKENTFNYWEQAKLKEPTRPDSSQNSIISSQISGISSSLKSIAVQTNETSFPLQRQHYPRFKNAAVQTVETLFPEAVARDPWLRLYDPKQFNNDSGVNSIACSPNEWCFNEGFDTPKGFPLDPFKNLSFIEPVVNEKKSIFADSIPYYSTFDSQVKFLFKNESYAIEVNQNGRKNKIKNSFGNEWTPLYLSMAESTSEVGEKAQSHYEKFPNHVIYDILKIIGKSKSDIQMDPKWGFKFVEINGISYFEIETPNGSRLLPQEIVIAAFLKTMKTQAESHLHPQMIKEICLLTDCKLTESQKFVFNNAASKIGLEILFYGLIDTQ